MNTVIEAALGQHYTSLTADGSSTQGGTELVTEHTFRAAMAALPTGVSVITTPDGDGVWGMTVGSLTSLSLRPPLLLVCLHRGSTTLELLAHQGRFAVSVLAEDQHEIANAFARPRTRGTAASSCTTADGLPVVAGAVAWFTCRHQHTYASGDHAIVIGAVEHAEHRPGEPLLRHASRYRRLH
ncbi:flavin reductase family protein [Micromonospora sp. NPDC048935]|uniref:flavin reductase family protein n=1 Tax=Micromonospora sp. NPDC048935 TaxID=3364262 RepID=UPI00371A3672